MQLSTGIDVNVYSFFSLREVPAAIADPCPQFVLVVHQGDLGAQTNVDDAFSLIYLTSCAEKGVPVDLDVQRMTPELTDDADRTDLVVFREDMGDLREHVGIPRSTAHLYHCRRVHIPHFRMRRADAPDTEFGPFAYVVGRAVDVPGASFIIRDVYPLTLGRGGADEPVTAGPFPIYDGATVRLVDTDYVVVSPDLPAPADLLPPMSRNAMPAQQAETGHSAPSGGRAFSLTYHKTGASHGPFELRENASFEIGSATFTIVEIDVPEPDNTGTDAAAPPRFSLRIDPLDRVLGPFPFEDEADLRMGPCSFTLHVPPHVPTLSGQPNGGTPDEAQPAARRREQPDGRAPADGQYPLQIRWQEDVSEGASLSDPPALVYHAATLPPVSPVLIVARFGVQGRTGNGELIQSPFYKLFALSQESGTIDTGQWGFVMRLTLGQSLGTTGEGTIHVALFDARPQAPTAERNACGHEPGRQVSEWLPLKVQAGW